jgi:hypothetical protein
MAIATVNPATGEITRLAGVPMTLIASHFAAAR